jgi:hypothetical protein
MRHKGEFSIMAEVMSLKDAKSWVVTSVYDPSKKSNGCVSMRLMNKLRHTHNSLALQYIPLQGRSFTWSHETRGSSHGKVGQLCAQPRLIRSIPHQWSHCPQHKYFRPLPSFDDMFLHPASFFQTRIWDFLAKLPSFMEVVQNSWYQ